MTINHPENLGTEANLIEYRSSSYIDWLKDNEELVSNITKVFKDGEVIHAFDYELEIGKESKSVNYSIHLLTTQKKDKGEFSIDYKNKKEVSKEIVVKGVLLIIEVISSSKRILSTLGRYGI